MHQWQVRALAEGGDEAIGRQFLAGAGTGRFGGEGGFEGFGLEGDFLGETVDEQITEPHGVTPKNEARIIRVARPGGQPRIAMVVGNARFLRLRGRAALSLWKCWENFFEKGVARS